MSDNVNVDINFDPDENGWYAELWAAGFSGVTLPAGDGYFSSQPEAEAAARDYCRKAGWRINDILADE